MPGAGTQGSDGSDGSDGAVDEPLCAQARALAAADGDDEDSHDQVVLLLRRAMASGESSARGLLATTHLGRGERREAVELLTPAVLHRGEVHLAGHLGEALAALGDYDGAEEAFLVGVSAEDTGTMNDYGVFLRGRGRTQEAVYVLDRAARAGDDLAQLNLVALHLEELDDRSSAAAIAEQYYDEARPSTLIALADVRLAYGRVDDAEGLYRRATELEGACAHIYYGWFLQDQRGDLEAAERALRRAHDLREPGASYHLGRFLFDIGRADEAQDWFEDAALHGDTDAEAVLEAEYRGLVDQYDD